LTSPGPIVEMPTTDVVDPHPWYAIRVRSNFEKTSSVALADRGVEVFLPTFQVRRRWSDRTKQMECPLFPGYLFSRIDMQNRLPVLTAPGIIQIIGAARTPIPVPDAEINALKSVLASRLAFEPWPYGCVGERVVVQEGPLTGVGGTLVRIKRNLRLLVSVELLQRSVVVEVDADWIARPDHSVHNEAVSLLMSSATYRGSSVPVHAISVPAM
jgi:transcription antitermination factor NusG